MFEKYETNIYLNHLKETPFLLDRSIHNIFEICSKQLTLIIKIEFDDINKYQ